MTKDTELGDNQSIKDPQPVESSRSVRRKEKSQSHKSAGTSCVRNPQENANSPSLDSDSKPSMSNSSPPRNFSALKRSHKERVIPELREEDLEESFVRGTSSPEYCYIVGYPSFFSRERSGMFLRSLYLHSQ